MATTRTTLALTSAASPTPVTISKTPMTHAWPTPTTPAATGRNRLCGCARSAVASRVSLRKYTPLEVMQKMAKANAASNTTRGWVIIPAAPGAAKTKTFFSHCLGRAVRTTPPIHDRAGPTLPLLPPRDDTSDGASDAPAGVREGVGAGSTRRIVAVSAGDRSRPGEILIAALHRSYPPRLYLW